ncbi:MAG: hypothetical protein GY937_25115 [bacterium]|nr:hypothetical protein [bacterium]
MSDTTSLDSLDVIGPDAYAKNGYPHAELAGPFERMRSSFLGGVKRMPIRFRIRPKNG